MKNILPSGIERNCPPYTMSLSKTAAVHQVPFLHIFSSIQEGKKYRNTNTGILLTCSQSLLFLIQILSIIWNDTIWKVLIDVGFPVKY